MKPPGTFPRARSLTPHARYREVATVERHARLGEAIPGSIGHMTWRVDGESGKPTRETREADCTDVLTRNEDGERELDVLIFHE
jgi:hypothetical protein